MALYAVIVEVSQPRPDVAMVHFELRDDTPNPDAVILAGTHGFRFVIRDVNGIPIAETATQRRNRMRAEFDAYVGELIDQATAVAAGFSALRTAALGYRFPAA